jgi:hypothetical protein
VKSESGEIRNEGVVPPAEFELLHAIKDVPAGGSLRLPSGLAALPAGVQIDDYIQDPQTPTLMTARPDHLKADST